MKSKYELLVEALDKRGYLNQDLVDEIVQIYGREQLTIHSVGNSTGYLVPGFIDSHPIYDKKGNWNTDVNIGDTLVCSAGGFGSEVLNYGERYKVVVNDNKIELEAENGDIINEWHTKNTMPFFTKLR